MFSALLERLARKLDQAGISYMVIGGQAVLVYGEPRTTLDINITVGLDTPELARLLNLTEQLGLRALPAHVGQFVEQTMVLPTRDEASGIRVDFIFSHSEYERRALPRARPVAVGQTEVRFAALEDLVIHKIIAGRVRDLEDARGVILKNQQGDWDYVRHWLTEFDRALATGFRATFEKTLRETARPPEPGRPA